MSYNGSFGYSGSFNLNQYAPVDPLAIPGLDLLNRETTVQEEPSSVPSTSSISPQNITASTKTEPVDHTSSSSYANPYETWKPSKKQKQDEKEKRRLETEEVRRKLKQAPVYKPTPIQRKTVFVRNKSMKKEPKREGCEKEIEVIDLVSSSDEEEVVVKDLKPPPRVNAPKNLEKLDEDSLGNLVKKEDEEANSAHSDDDDDFENYVAKRRAKIKHGSADSSDSGCQHDKNTCKTRSESSSSYSEEVEETSESSADSMEDFIVSNSDEEDDIWTKKSRRKKGRNSSGDEYEPEEMGARKKVKKTKKKEESKKCCNCGEAKKKPEKKRVRKSSEEDRIRKNRKILEANKEREKSSRRHLEELHSKDLKKRDESMKVSDATSEESIRQNVKKSKNKQLTREEAEKLRKEKNARILQRLDEAYERKRKIGFSEMKSAHVGHWKREEEFRKKPKLHEKILKNTTEKGKEKEKPDASTSKLETLKRKLSDDTSDKPSTSTTKKVVEKEPEPVEKYPNLAPKRVAHSASATESRRPLPPPPLKTRKVPNYRDSMLNAYEEAQEKARKEKEEAEKLKTKKYLTQEEMFGQKKSAVGSMAKGEARVARPLNHTTQAPPTRKPVSVKTELMSPQKSANQPPKLPPAPPFLEPLNKKIPANKRREVVQKLFEELYWNKKEGADKEAQAIELRLMHDSSNEKSYLVKRAHEIRRLRQNSDNVVIEVAKKTVSHEVVMAGRRFNQVSAGVKRQHRIPYEKMTSEDIAKEIRKMKASTDELRENAFPLMNHETMQAVIQPTVFDEKKKNWLDDGDTNRTCCRCFADFKLTPNGEVPLIKCNYHDRGFTRSQPGAGGIQQHQCCQSEKGAPPCKSCDTHVFDQLLRSELATFVQAPPPTIEDDPRSKAIFALDCEMVYTLKGPALARLSMVNVDRQMVLDVIIRPPSTVLDTNFDFSGLTQEQVENAEYDLEGARAELFKLINSETILIGHSLESDFKAMRLVHLNVVDTSLLFKGRGIYKQSLKKLAADQLRVFIQSDRDVSGGHNSTEDALTCIELVRHRIKTNM